MIAAVLVLLAQSAVATPAPAPPAPTDTSSKLGGGFGQKTQPGQKTRVVVTDDTLTAPKSVGAFSVSGQPGTQTAQAAPAASAAPTSGGKPAPTAHPASDEESSWKARVTNLRSSLAKAEAELDDADKANTVVSFGRPGNDYETLMAIRNAALVPYRTKVADIRRELDSLPEECRKSPGCQPGWVR